MEWEYYFEIEDAAQEALESREKEEKDREIVKESVPWKGEFDEVATCESWRTGQIKIELET